MDDLVLKGIKPFLTNRLLNLPKDSLDLVISTTGKRVIYRSIYKKIKKLGNKSGIGKIHPHILRHTYLTRLYNVGNDLRFVQDQARHTSPMTTAIYAKTNSRALSLEFLHQCFQLLFYNIRSIFVFSRFLSY